MIPPFSSANNTSGNSKSANSNSGEQRLISPIGRSEDQNDNKTTDCFSTRHAVKQGERLVIVLRGIIEKRGRTSVLEVKQWIGVSERATLTFIRQLMAEGYLESNSSKPLSLKATDKAKQLFGVTA